MADDFDEKWARYVRGDVTLEDITDVVIQGDIAALRTARLGEIKGSTKEAANKVGITVIHIGYTQDEINSTEFQDYLDNSALEFYESFGSKYFRIRHLVPEDDLPLTIRRLQQSVFADCQEVDVMFNRLNDNKIYQTDLIELRVNPEKVGTNFFGGSIDNFYVSPGPEITKNRFISPDEKCISQHEFMHSLSILSKIDLTEIDDGYFQQQSTEAIDRIKQGCHSEFFMEDPENSGQPVASRSPAMLRALAKIRPEFYDTGIMLRDKDGTKHRLLTPSPRDNIMSNNGMFKDEREALEANGGQYITDFHKALVEELAKAYLVGKGRIKADEKLEESGVMISGEEGGILLGNTTTKLPVAVQWEIAIKTLSNRRAQLVIHGY